MSPAALQHKKLSRAAKASALVLAISLGLWGCARNSTGQSNNNDRIRAVEARCVKLEQDYRSVAQARDKVKKDLATMEEEVSRLQKELSEHVALLHERDELQKQLKVAQGEREQARQSLSQRTTERDELQQQVAQRTGERDHLQNRCDRLRKGIQSLLTQDDAPAGSSPAPATTVPTSPTTQNIPSNGPALGGQS